MTHWDEYTFDRKLRAFEAIGFVQGEAVKLADVPWDNFTSEVQKALEGEDEYYEQKFDDDQEEEIVVSEESYDYNSIGTNELQRTKYQCEFCNCGYKSNESLSVHLNDIHTQTLGEVEGYGLSASESSYHKANESKARENIPSHGTPNGDWLWTHFSWESSMDQDDIECKKCGFWVAPRLEHGYSDEGEIMRVARDHMRGHGVTEARAIEVKIPQGDLHQGGQKVGTIRDYNSKQHEGYVTLDGIGIEEFGAMTSDYEVYVNGERIPNKWDGKHDYNLDLFGEAKTEEEREADDMAFDALEEQGQSGNPYNIFKKKSSEDDPDFENDPDFEGNLRGKKVAPSQYTQSGMDHTDRSRGDVDFDGEAEVPTSMSEEDRARLELRNQDADEDPSYAEEAVRQCPNCGYNDNDGRSLSCVSCGQDFPSNEEPSTQAQEVDEKTCDQCGVDWKDHGINCRGEGSALPEAHEVALDCERCGRDIGVDSNDVDDTADGPSLCDRCFNAGESKAREYGSPLHGTWDQGGNFFGIQNMTRDDYEGTVYWKGEPVEHYDHDYFAEDGFEADMERDARALAKQCEDLESRGIKPTMSAILSGESKAKELFGNNDPDEIMGGNWGTPEDTHAELYGMTSHNYDDNDKDVWVDKIVDKMGSNSNGKFSSSSLDLFLRNKGLTNEDMIYDLVMEYGGGYDPIS